MQDDHPKTDPDSDEYGKVNTGTEPQPNEEPAGEDEPPSSGRDE
jgi:hypothetical protein